MVVFRPAVSLNPVAGAGLRLPGPTLGVQSALQVYRRPTAALKGSRLGGVTSRSGTWTDVKGRGGGGCDVK